MLLKKLSLFATRAVIVLMTILGFSSGVSAQNFAQIYVFGDSLSDVGNIFMMTRGDFPPSPPYFQGRYSNGPVWTEYLASKLKLSSNSDTNFAYGGATTGDSQQIPLGLLAQIESFTATYKSAIPNALYIVWAGANDYLGGVTDSAVPIDNITRAVRAISAVGAKNIAVVNLPNLGQIPETRTSQRSGLLTNLTNKHNSGLATSLNSLRQELGSEINITYLDVNSIFNQVIQAPEKFGFTNVTQPCIRNASICSNPNQYLFWDNIHPTTAAHKLFGEIAFSDIKPMYASSSISASKLTFFIGMLFFSTLGTGLVMKRKKASINRLKEQ